MILAAFGSGQVLYSIFWLFLFIVWFWMLIAIFGDLFRDHELSGWGKAGWAFLIIFFFYIGIFAYLIVRGPGMAQRAMAQQKEAQDQFDSYVRETAGAGGGGGGGGAASEIEKAKGLLDSGAISQEEFDQLKRNALG